MSINFKDIENAYKKISNSIIKTPLVSNDYINSLLESEVYFKLENLQNTVELACIKQKISNESYNDR